MFSLLFLASPSFFFFGAGAAPLWCDIAPLPRAGYAMGAASRPSRNSNPRRAAGKLRHHLSWPGCALCPRARSYYNGSKLFVTLAHFLPFKSCFGWSTQTYRNITHCWVESRSDEAWPGTEYTGYGSLVQKYLALAPYQCLELGLKLFT